MHNTEKDNCCMTIPWTTLIDLKNPKKIPIFYTQKLDNDLKTSKTERIEKLKQEIADIKKETIYLTNGIQELKGEKVALDKTLDEKESRLDSLEKVVEQNKIKQEKEIKECNESHAKNVQKLEEEFERQIEEADHCFQKEIKEINEVKKQLNQNITTLKEDCVVMKNDLKQCKEIFDFLDKNYCQSYIGEVCLNLQANMYHIVLPKQFAENFSYKIKDIEGDIEDEELLSDEERQEASKRWEDLKEKLRWNPSLERTLKMLQKEGNPMDHPDLTVKEAERVVEELNKQGRLRGITSYEKVQTLIEMWKMSVTLVQSLL